MKIKIINGDLLTSNEKYIAHQTNCCSVNTYGIAKSIFEKFEYANIYSKRKVNSIPGTIDVCGNGTSERFVINMFAQFYPGKPKYTNSKIDGFSARESYFNSCLKKITLISNLETIAFPYFIGCGVAGGNWNNYLMLIEKFANDLYKMQNASVVLYKI